ncbi:unknown function [Vibrio phage D479]
MEKPTLIFDVDGVLIQWESQLPFFCAKNGIDPTNVLKHFTCPVHSTPNKLLGIRDHKMASDMLQRYNIEHGKYMTAFTDAVESIHKLARDYNLIALTKFGNTTEHWTIRKFNLETFFPRCFKELITIEYTESKVPYVHEIMGRENVVGFIDDQLENINEIRDNCGVETVFLNRFDDHADLKSVGEIKAYLNRCKAIHP